MRDAEGTILYVGKAADLSQRVRSYFIPVQKLPPKLQFLVEHVHDIDFYITNLEQEALILESNLIKRYHPHYNVRLKDDKTFPYIKIDLSEEWPRVRFTRLLEEDGAHYFGPFASARSVRQTLKVIRTIFPFRTCSRTITGTDSRPCLKYHIRRCTGPCIGAVTREEYDEMMKQVILFLEGKQDSVVRELDKKMKESAEALDFEKAVLFRDQIQAIDRVIEGQKIAATTTGEQDVIAFAEDRDQAYVQVFYVRNDKLVGRDSFILEGTGSEEPEQIMSSFIKQFYGSASYIPPLLVLQHPVDDMEAILQWLQGKRSSRVRIQVPARGNKKRLVDIVTGNAEQGLQQLKIKHLAVPATLTAALEELQAELGLPGSPSRLEGYDISNIQGTGAVGSMVVFEDGRPKPSLYRRFKIKTVSGANDYAMLQEVLRRRFKRIAVDGVSADTQDAWSVMPDLVLIDGGKGQLNAALVVMDEIGAGKTLSSFPAIHRPCNYCSASVMRPTVLHSVITSRYGASRHSVHRLMQFPVSGPGEGVPCSSSLVRYVQSVKLRLRSWPPLKVCLCHWQEKQRSFYSERCLQILPRCTTKPRKGFVRPRALMRR